MLKIKEAPNFFVPNDTVHVGLQLSLNVRILKFWIFETSNLFMVIF
jgi:hypothetical protein